MEYDCVSPDRQGLAKELDERLGQYSALAHASMAKVASAAADSNLGRHAVQTPWWR